MTGLVQGLLTATAVGSVLILLLLGLGKALDRRFAPRWRHWAWLAVALRLAVPLNFALPQAPIRVAVPQAAAQAWTQPVRPPAATPSPPKAQGAQAVSPAGPAVSAPEEAAPVRWGGVVMGLWALGAAGFLLWQAAGYGALRRGVRRRGRYVEDYAGLSVWECPELSSPVLMGFFRPVIVLPEGLGGERRAFALLHEATHFRRRDLWYKLLLVWCNALHWFNPLVWVFRRAAAGDVELACDEALLKGRDTGYRAAYGTALVDQAAGGRQRGAALTSAFSGGRGSLKRRVTALLDTRPKKAGRAALCLLCAAALLGGGLVACEEKDGGTESFPVVIYGFEGDSVVSPPASITYRYPDAVDPVTGTVYYHREVPGEGEALHTAEVAEHADYVGFPTTLPNSDRVMHPGVALRMGQMLSSQYHAVVLAQVTVKDGVVTALVPLEDVYELSAGQTVDVLKGAATEQGETFRYRNASCGFALDIPTETARNLVVLSTSSTALGEVPAGWVAPVAVYFVDRRFMGAAGDGLPDLTWGVGLAVLYTQQDEIDVVAPRLSRLTRENLDRFTELSDGEKEEILQDKAVLEALDVQAVGPEARYYVSGARLAGGRLSGQYRAAEGGGEERRSLPLHPAGVIVQGAGVTPTGSGLEWLVDHWAETHMGVYPGLPVTVFDGEVVQVGEAAAPVALKAVWMGAEGEINVWRLELAGEHTREGSAYRLEFEEDSPLWELMGMNPSPGQLLFGVVVFIAGRNSMTEAEFLRLTAGDPACTLVVEDTATGVERRYPAIVRSEEQPGGGIFHNLRSKNPGDGTLEAQWEEFSGAYHGYSFRVGEARAVTVTCAMSDNVTLTLIFPDGTEQVLGAGENEVALPVGTTQLELGSEGGSGSFSLALDPAEGIGVSG